MIHRPELLILDEPTSGLDPLIQSRFFDLLHEENRQGTTVFLQNGGNRQRRKDRKR
jgi:ABC-2 type transport system ATP-binding protein